MTYELLFCPIEAQAVGDRPREVYEAMKCSEQAVPLWAVSCFSGSFDAASKGAETRHQKVLRRGIKRCALRPPDTAIRGEFRDGGCLEATQVYKYLSRVDKLRANPAGFRVSAAQPKSDAGGRPQVVLRHVGRAAVKGAARMAGAASSGRPIPDGERVTRVNIGSNRSFQKMKWQSRGRTGLSLYL